MGIFHWWFHLTDEHDGFMGISSVYDGIYNQLTIWLFNIAMENHHF